jgi:hypothetical protein
VDGFKNAALYIPAVGIVTPICIMITVIQELINGPMGPIIGLLVNLPIIAAVSYGEIPKKFHLVRLLSSLSCYPLSQHRLPSVFSRRVAFFMLIYIYIYISTCSPATTLENSLPCGFPHPISHNC